MLLTTLSSGILSTCPTQLSLLTFNVPYYIFMVNQVFQLLVCSLSPFVFCVGPKILLNNLISNTNNFCLMFSVNTQHSDLYTATGLITVWYSLSLVFLVISLLWNIFLFAKKVLLPAAILSFISSSITLSAFIIVPRYLTEFTSLIFIPSIYISLFFTLVCTLECLIYFVLFWFITNSYFIASCCN